MKEVDKHFSWGKGLGLATILFAVVGLSGAGSHTKTEYYHCYRPVTKTGNVTLGWFEELILIEGEQGSRRIISDNAFTLSHDEGSKLTTVYKYRMRRASDTQLYQIHQMDFSSGTITYFRGIGIHTTHDQFQKDHPGHTLSQWNPNPEFLKYLPDRPPEKDLSYAYIKLYSKKIPCKKLSYAGYMFYKVKITLLNLLSA